MPPKEGRDTATGNTHRWLGEILTCGTWRTDRQTDTPHTYSSNKSQLSQTNRAMQCVTSIMWTVNVINWRRSSVELSWQHLWRSMCHDNESKQCLSSQSGSRFLKNVLTLLKIPNRVASVSKINSWIHSSVLLRWQTKYRHRFILLTPTYDGHFAAPPPYFVRTIFTLE